MQIYNNNLKKEGHHGEYLAKAYKGWQPTSYHGTYTPSEKPGKWLTGMIREAILRHQMKSSFKGTNEEIKSVWDSKRIFKYP